MTLDWRQTGIRAAGRCFVYEVLRFHRSSISGTLRREVLERVEESIADARTYDHAYDMWAQSERER